MEEELEKFIGYLDKKFEDVNQKLGEIARELENIKEKLKEKADKDDIRELKSAIDACSNKSS